MNERTYAHAFIIPKSLNKIFFCLSIVCLIHFKGFTQQFNNWYFPLNNGVTFNTNPPSYLSGSQFSINSNSFSSSTISDRNGNLSFSSDGVFVWDRNNNQMPNGFGLKGDYSQINGALIIPFLNDTSKYYLFTSKGLVYGTTQPDTFRYSYSVVDMSLNGGLGDITNKNTDIRGFAAEKMVAIPHANGNDIWWICRDWTNHFYSYKITCSGFQNSNPVISTVGNNINFNTSLLLGDIKASPDGKMIAAAYSFIGSNDLGYFEIYKFDNVTGVLSSPISISAKVVYGVEFSPNSKVIYISQRFEQNNIPYPTITQYNINNYDSSAIISSLFKVAEISLETGLQLGPNNKIYAPVSFTDSNFQFVHGLDVINNPDVPGVGCNYQSQVVSLPNQTYRRLPYSFVNLITNQNIQIPTYTVAADCRTVTLTAKTYIQGSSLSFKWKFGDGDSTIQNVTSGGDTTYTSVTHTYLSNLDSFIVSVAVTSDTVCGQGNASKKILLKPNRPTALFNTGLINCGDLSVQFRDSSLLNSNPSLSYKWAYKRAGSSAVFTNFSVLPNPVFSFPAFDSFSIRLIVTSSLACVAADTIVKNIVLKATPVADFTFAVNCGSRTVSFINSSSVEADTLNSYQWYFGSEGTASQKNPSFTFTRFGNNQAKLLVTSSSACRSDTFSLPIVVRAQPLATILYNNNACANLPFSITATDSISNASIVNRTWLVNDVAAGDNTNLLSLTKPGGTYQVKYVTLSSQGCSSDTAVENIVVEDIPTVSFTVQGGCAGKNIVLQNSSAGAASYNWQFGNGDTAAGISPVYTYNAGGSYSIRLEASSANGCKASSTLPILIESTPIIDFTTTELCVGKRIVFTNNSKNTVGSITNYTWNFGNDSTVLFKDAATTFNRAGSYNIKLTASTANGCTNSLAKNLAVLSVEADAGNNVSIAQNSPYTLLGSGGGNYAWQPASLLNDPTIANPTTILQNDQLFRLEVTSAAGCKGYDSVFIKVQTNIFIPNAFAPGGINKFWRIKNLEGYVSAKLLLYNRYGQKLFEGSPANSYAWDGTFKGNMQPAGAYVYILHVFDGKVDKTLKGTVMLVR